MKSCLQTFLRVALGGLFIYAGVVKSLDPAVFTEQIRGYRLLPEPLPAAVALYLPWLEIVCGAALVASRFYVGAVMWLVTLMGIFLLAILSAWARGLDIRCGCFGRTDVEVNYPWLIIRDLLILTGLIVLVVWRKATPNKPTALSQPMHSPQNKTEKTTS